ncbi:MAG TPA: hypothetical protein VHE35_30555 [Kofleriaceae bacterium]|nr:hypothetical protein [Kofleriaceae bacterium]
MRALTFTIVAALAGAACTDPGGSPDPGDTFIAFNNSFAPFRTWTMVHDDLEDPGGVLPAGVAGPRDQFLNRLPPAGSTEFPIGTIVVEVRTDSGKIFASVKRGGDYNAAGAHDWEFFELTETPSVRYLWRGLGPPLGDTYGGDPNGCNSCHAQCAANDYICSPKLQLASFQGAR